MLKENELYLNKLYSTKKYISGPLKANIPPKQLTYGEITRNGVQKILNEYNSFINEDTVFYDLGSGLGKFVIHFSLTEKIKKAVGVEIHDKRYAYALKNSKMFSYSSKENPTFLHQNIFSTDYSEATFVYWDNTCFTSQDLDLICELLPKGCLILVNHYLRKSVAKFERAPFKYETTYANQRTLYWKVI